MAIHAKPTDLQSRVRKWHDPHPNQSPPWRHPSYPSSSTLTPAQPIALARRPTPAPRTKTASTKHMFSYTLVREEN